MTAALGPGGTLRHIYEGLGVANDLVVLELDPDGYDHVVMGEERVDLPKGREHFAARLKARLPSEAPACANARPLPAPADVGYTPAMGTIAVSGSASGIGAAIRAQVERDDHRVIGIDLREAEVTADLSHASGRRRAVEEVRALADGRLDGLVACAGLGPQVSPWEPIVSLNYFGAVALLADLRDALAAATGAAAVAVSSNSSTIPGMDTDLVAACLADDEPRARAIAPTLDGQRVYAGSKLALARWIRRMAPTDAWAGAGIRLNAVAPGAVRTPLLDAGLADPVYGDLIRAFPIPTGGFGTPEEVAAAVVFLLSPAASFCCGSVLFVDGGSDALLRPDAY